MILYRDLQDSDGNRRPYQFFAVGGPIETERTLIWWHWIRDWYGNWCSLNTASNFIRKWLLFGHGDWYGHGDGHGDGHSVNVASEECRDEYYTVDSLNALFETIPETCIVEFLREAGFFYLIWCNLLTPPGPQTWKIWSDLSNREWKQLWDTFTCIGRLFREWKQLLRHIYLCRTANMSWRTCVVVKQIQSNQPSPSRFPISGWDCLWRWTP